MIHQAYTDPDANVDIHKGLPRLREAWIDSREDTAFKTVEAFMVSTVLRAKCQMLPYRPVKASQEKNVTQMLCAQGCYHTGNGICRHPRKPKPRSAKG